MKPAVIRTYQRRKATEAELTSERAPRRVFHDQTNLASATVLPSKQIPGIQPEEDLGEPPAPFDSPPKDLFVANFERGSAEDKRHIANEWDWSQNSQRVPGEWKLERQMRFGAWCQLMGLTCEWEGGYLFVHLTQANCRDLKYCFNSPKLEVCTTLARESSVAESELEDDFNAMRISIAPAVPANHKRNRQRKWQEQHDNGSSAQLEPRPSFIASAASALVDPGGARRSSTLLFPRRSSVAMTQRRSSLFFSASVQSQRQSLAMEEAYPRTSSALLMRKTVFQVIAEEEEEEEEEEETNLLNQLPQDLLFHVLDFLPVALVLTQLTSLSRTWNTIATRHANLHFANNLDAVLNAKLYLEQNRGRAKFLGEGAYKSVYLLDECEAVSVMKISQSLRDVVTREVAVSLILADLVQQDICPNFIQTKRVFQLNASPDWAGGSMPGHFQYISMELCEKGDLEEFIKTFPGGMPPAELSRSIIFQMCFSLFAARRAAKMRHYDVKCLNFFCKTAGSAGRLSFAVDEASNMRCAFESDIIVKLADYGTADLDSGNLGKPIDLAHFTTLENTPIEFLLFPDAVQSYAADVFQLGLSVFHVLTGGLPYEEILVQVRCPPAFKEEIAKVWRGGEGCSNGFKVLQYIVEEDEEDVMFHTLYRFLVLFGFGEEETEPKTARFHPSRSKVMAAARALLLGEQASTTGRRVKAAVIAARKQFAADAAMFSFRVGTHHLIARGRERAKALGMWGERGLFWGLLQYCPEMRLSARDALLQSSAFPTTCGEEEDDSLTVVFGRELFNPEQAWCQEEEADVF